MYYDNYLFLGMHIIWWFVWGFLIFWIFLTPYDVPGQRNKKDAPLDILKKRLTAGKINLEEFQASKKIIES